MKKKHLIIGIFSIVLFASCTKDVKQEEQELLSVSNQENFFEKLNISPGSFVPGELLVKFKKGRTQTSKQNAFARISGSPLELIITSAMKTFGNDEGIYLVKTSLETKDAINTMRSMDDVEYAEPNYIYTHDATSNDTYYTNGSLWGMYGLTTSPANQFGSGAGAAWGAGKTGAATVV
ncbi:MAG: peptidase S8, partial [Flavisolibacter sp.]|nr:peptidase S8 [Flavisolibacter sp.]